MRGPQDLPRRLAASVDGAIDAAGELPEVQRELLAKLTSIDRGIETLTVAIVTMQADMETLAAHSRRLERIEELVAHIDEQIPGPG